MKRGASGDIFLKLIERIRRTIPGIAIRTSFIAGFPGETDADFQALCDFVKAAQFDRLGVFSYSDEDTSGSYALDGKVDGRTINNRKRTLMAIQRRISRARNRQMVGNEVAVLVEGPSADTDLLWQARMSTQAPEIDGVVLINDVEGAPPQAGQMRPLRITETHDYDIIGTLLPATEGEVRVSAPPPHLIGITVPSQLPAR
jgi:ribosomal protein S12 methylthiotransferase